MDPFIENQDWADFHTRFITELSIQLVPRVRPRYEVKLEHRVYLERFPAEPTVIRRDLAVLGRETGGAAEEFGSTAVAAAVAPAVYTLPMPDKIREAYLLIRERGTKEVVTIIELLSPGNKRRGGDGQIEYLNKRMTVLQSPTHLAEIDLLRGGERPPTVERLRPTTDYCAYLSRRGKRSAVEVYEWTVRHRLPRILVPLALGDRDVELDLQEVFTVVYDGAGYDYSIDYAQAIEPPLRESDVLWVRNLIGGKSATT